MIEVVSVKSDEIVFSSAESIERFYDEITNGKNVILKFKDGKMMRSELVVPNIAPLVNDGKIKIKSEQVC
jgi:hypothetical protein